MTNDVKWPYVAFVTVCLLVSPSRSSGQDNDDLRDFDLTRESATTGQCRDAACQRLLREIGAAAAATASAKAAFVDALRLFVEGLAGTFGDEGPRVRTALADMGAALTRWDSAIGKYRDALSVASGAEVHVALGTTYLDRGRMQEAIEQFRRAVALAPASGESWLLLGLAHDAFGAHQDAERALTRASRTAPDSPAIAYAIVQHAIGTGNESLVSEALLQFGDSAERSLRKPAAGAAALPFVRFGLLREAAGGAPVFVPAQYTAGLKLLNGHRYDEAVKAFHRAVDQDPLCANDVSREERVQGGKVLRDGDVLAAVMRLERAVAKWPDASELRRLLATAYAFDERYEQSIEQLTLAIRQDARDERSRLALAQASLAAGRPDAAERTLQETVEALPDSGRAYYRLGRLYQSHSRTPDAITALARSAEYPILVGRDALYETIAALRVSEGEFDAAIAVYRLELHANPNNAAAHRRLGDLYAQDGRLDQALAEYAAALLIDPRDADTHASRAQALLRLSRFVEAETAARAAVSLNLVHEAARYALGTALIRTGRADEGQTALLEFERLQTATRARNDAAWQLKLLKERALEHAARQEYRAAADLLREAVKYSPPDGSIHLAAGAALIQAGEVEQAIPLLKEAVSREAFDAHRYLAEAYAALGRGEESRAHRAAYEAVKGARVRRSAAVQ